MDKRAWLSEVGVDVPDMGVAEKDVGMTETSPFDPYECVHGLRVYHV
jgi:hypothetical protein